MLEVYTEGVRDADAMLGRLTAYFAEREEPVVLVFYGDHLPYLGDNQKGYAELGSEVSIPENEREDILCSYKTPYVLWANDAAADTLNWERGRGRAGPAGGRRSLCFLFRQRPAGPHRPRRGKSVVRLSLLPPADRAGGAKENLYPGGRLRTAAANFERADG